MAPIHHHFEKKGWHENKIIIRFWIIAFMANLLSHDNPSSMNLCIKEVNDFCQAVHQLHEVFECPDCNNFIKYNSEFGILRCSNKKCEKPFEERTR